MTLYQDCCMTFEVHEHQPKTSHEILEQEEKIKSVMSCPLCSNTAIEIVGHCATCKICGWSLCSA